MDIIGRKKELEHMQKIFSLGRNLLLEGPVGVGKTYLVQTLLNKSKKGFERIDGDNRYTEQKLTGWFDPPLVIKQGYKSSSFVDGPLVSAMKEGKALFINELNRMPESVQNILLPAMDEQRIQIPKLGSVEAKKGFFVIATQNPREFTATHSLSEALMDRFEMITLDYQSRDEEFEILKNQRAKKTKNIDTVLDIVRATRVHASIKRGASIRAALAICDLMELGIGLDEACLMALPSRVELLSSEENVEDIILGLITQPNLESADQKKKYVG